MNIQFTKENMECKLQVVEITPAPSWDYDSFTVDATDSWSDVLDVVERVLDRQLDEIAADPEYNKWEGRTITLKLRRMSRAEFDELLEA